MLDIFDSHFIASRMWNRIFESDVDGFERASVLCHRFGIIVLGRAIAARRTPFPIRMWCTRFVLTGIFDDGWRWHIFHFIFELAEHCAFTASAANNEQWARNGKKKRNFKQMEKKEKGKYLNLINTKTVSTLYFCYTFWFHSSVNKQTSHLLSHSVRPLYSIMSDDFIHRARSRQIEIHAAKSRANTILTLAPQPIPATLLSSPCCVNTEYEWNPFTSMKWNEDCGGKTKRRKSSTPFNLRTT